MQQGTGASPTCMMSLRTLGMSEKKKMAKRPAAPASAPPVMELLRRVSLGSRANVPPHLQSTDRHVVSSPASFSAMLGKHFGSMLGKHFRSMLGKHFRSMLGKHSLLHEQPGVDAGEIEGDLVAATPVSRSRRPQQQARLTSEHRATGTSRTTA